MAAGPGIRRRTCDVLIVGAGPAGLAAAIAAERLGASTVVLEAGAEPGGLTRSFRTGGYTFDRCGHVLHVSHPDARRLLDQVTSRADWVDHERRSAVRLRDRLVPYPFQLHLGHAPDDVRDECLAALPSTAADLGGDPARVGLLDWVQATLGAGIARHFMVPYNEKLATVPIAELTCEWLGRFVPAARPADVHAGARSTRSVGVGYNRRFLYPRAGGIDLLPRSLVSAGVTVQTGARVAAVDAVERTARLETGERIGYREGLIASIPLPQLCALTSPRGPGVEAGGRLLRSTAVTCVNLGLRSLAPELSDVHWVYLPERRFRAYRVGFYNRFSQAMAPPGREGAYVEVAHGARASERELIASAIADLVELGAIASDADVELAAPVRVQVAYVIPDRDCAPVRERARAELAAGGVHTIGRYGRWEYSSIEDALVQGLEAVGSVLGAPATAGREARAGG